jgi:cytochrome c553
MIGRAFKLITALAGLAAGGVLAAARGLPPASDAASAAPPLPRSPSIAGVRLTLILKIVAALGVLAVVGGLLVSASGVVPIKASAGHWAVTRWFLQFSKERSVATHTLGLAAPPLDDPALALKGAGHFESGCAPCHGSPALDRPRVAWRMLPHPPSLAERAPQWESPELFYIVKHGIKFAGMPAWPSPDRDDEVWAMVAFLRRLPELDAAAYRRLALGEGREHAAAVPLAGLVVTGDATRVLAESCARCHGFDGLGRGSGAFPKLAGQRAEYLLASLAAYARDERHSGVMQPVAAGLGDETRRALADYYARLPRPAPSAQDAAAVERGRLIAAQGLASQRVPACAACHGPGPAPRNPVYPALAGQYADYLELQLRLFKQGRRGGTAYAHVMDRAAAGLTEGQMRDAAQYYAALPPAAAAAAPR